MKHFLKGTIGLLLFVLITIDISVVAQGRSPKDYYQEIKPLWEQTDVNAMNFGFVNRDGNRFTMNLGTPHSRQEELSSDHIFRIASMTKAITSVALLQLIEQGLADIDDNAGKYLPEIDKIPILTSDGKLVMGNYPITLRHLLTHTSGFGYSFVDKRLADFEKPDNWPHKDLPRLAEAGTQWNYGTGTDWVGRIVEQISGLNLEDYFRQNITGPLNMDRTWFVLPDSLTPYLVSLGSRQALSEGETKAPVLSARITPVSYSGGGGLYSSLNDYLTFLECLLHGGGLNGIKILEKTTVDMMFVDQLPSVFANAGNIQEGEIKDPSSDFAFGLAWGIQTSDNEYGRKEGSAYWSGIYNTYYSIDLNTGIAVVTMANLTPFGERGALMLYKKFEELVRE